jgi:hypothetical protein
MKKPLLTPTETKILKMCLVDDDRVQQHHAYMFNCHYLPDIIQHLRKKLKKHFGITHEDVKNNLYTEYRTVIKENGKKAKVGIFRLTPAWKKDVALWLEDEVQESQN